MHNFSLQFITLTVFKFILYLFRGNGWYAVRLEEEGDLVCYTPLQVGYLLRVIKLSVGCMVQASCIHRQRATRSQFINFLEFLLSFAQFSRCADQKGAPEQNAALVAFLTCPP